MNPRVSLLGVASKATGFPIAKVAKLAVSYLDELGNEITASPGLVRADDRLRRHQDAAFHVREIPGAEPLLSTSMKSVGEAITIGRSFADRCRRRCAR
jgi:carbamoyl-phosphate synthase large subunit